MVELWSSAKAWEEWPVRKDEMRQNSVSPIPNLEKGVTHIFDLP
jgi:hypothetical protein